MPLPFARRARESSARKKRSKTFSSRPGGTPGPRSATTSSTAPFPALEDLLLEAGRDARAAVGDDELDGVAVGRALRASRSGGAHGHLRRRAGRVFGGVVEEVGEDPAEGVGIGERGEAALAVTSDERRVTSGGVALGAHFLEQRGEVDALQIEAAAAALEAAEVEEVGDEAVEAVGFGEDGAHRLVAAGTVGEAALGEQLGAEADAGEWGLELVRDVVDEVRLAKGVEAFAARGAQQDVTAGDEGEQDERE